MPFLFKTNFIEASAVDKKKTNMFLLDVRSPESYADAHLQGFVNVCVYEVAFYEKIPQVIPDKSSHIITFNHKHDSLEGSVAAEKLMQLGYSNVLVVKGNIHDLIAAGFSLEGKEEKLHERLVLKDGKYIYDSGQVSWIGRNTNGKHMGTVMISSAEIAVSDNNLQGNIEVDMDTIANSDLEDAIYNQLLVNHLKSDDFFSVKKFKNASFIFYEAMPNPEATCSNQNYVLKGTMNIAGIEHKMSIPATLVQKDDTLLLEAHFDIDRTLWNVMYGSAKFFAFLGMHMIFDPISLEVMVKFKK